MSREDAPPPPTPDRARVEALFEAALQLPAGPRADFVSAACGGDASMEQAVRALLAAHSVSNGILEHTTPAVVSAETPPLRAGAYRILREVGRGGMGVVYDAERDDGHFRRRVAIKILRSDGGPDLHARVLAERQIMAALDHPNIARLLDGGVTDDGRPYLAMEHVEGLPIDVYCDRMRMDVSERLRLFCEVARAVDFAHRSLVVHRDLKPSNILVTPGGDVKLLDFGVAKLLNAWATGSAAPVTRDRLALTPEYASPEQLRAEGLTTTSDVYSLGVVLYELLTGSRPHAEHEHAPAHLIAAICSSDAERASLRVLRATNPAVAAARQSTPQRLGRALRGDVDAILSVALRREPARRYASAELLAQDIERHLQHRRVHAHQRSRGYTVAKAIRRHRLGAAAALLAAVSLLTGAGVAAWQAGTAHRERLRAEAALAHSEQVSGFLLGLFDRENVGGTVPAFAARDVVQRGIARIEALSAQPLLQVRLLRALGNVLASLGDYDEAQRQMKRALDVLEASDGAGSLVEASLLVDIGGLQRQRSVYDSAFVRGSAALSLQQQLGADAAAIGWTLNRLAGVMVYLGDLPAAQRYADEAYELQRREYGEVDRRTINALQLVGTIQWRRDDFAVAEQTLRRVIDLRRLDTASPRSERLTDRLQLTNVLLAQPQRIAEAEPMLRSIIAELADADVEHNSHLFWARGSLAMVLEQRGDRAAADRMRHENVELRRSAYGYDHPAVGEAIAGLGRIALRDGRLDDADRLHAEAASIIRRAYGERHNVYAGMLMDRGRVLAARGQLVSADSLMALAVAIRAEQPGRNSYPYVEALIARAEVQQRLGAYTVAEEMLLEGLRIRMATHSPNHRMVRETHAAATRLYEGWGRTADAARHRQLSLPD